MNFKLFGKTILVVYVQFGYFFWAIHSASEEILKSSLLAAEFGSARNFSVKAVVASRPELGSRRASQFLLWPKTHFLSWWTLNFLERPF